MNITVIIVIAIVFGITALVCLFFIISSKKDTPVVKLSLIVSILSTLFSIVSFFKIDTDINRNNDNIANVIRSIVIETEESVSVSNAIEEAKDALEKSGYLPAINILNEAKKKYPDNRELDTAIEELNLFKPVPLVNCKWLKNTAEDAVKHQTYKNVYLKDKFSNTYSSSFSLSGGSVIYAINQNYTTFTGTIACPDEIEYTSNADYSKISIYGDGNFIWSSSPMYVDSEPQPFSINITGIKKLELRWECSGYNIWENWGYYSTIMDGTLQKN